MGYGMWGKTWPARKAVDGNIDPNMGHHHCAWAQGEGPLTCAWKIDLEDFYDIDKITLYANNRECIELENMHGTNTTGIKTSILIGL